MLLRGDCDLLALLTGDWGLLELLADRGDDARDDGDALARFPDGLLSDRGDEDLDVSCLALLSGERSFCRAEFSICLVSACAAAASFAVAYGRAEEARRGGG